MLNIFLCLLFSGDFFLLDIKKLKCNVTRFVDLYFYCRTSSVVLETVWKVLFAWSTASQGGTGEGIRPPGDILRCLETFLIVTVVGVCYLIPHIGSALG